MNTLENPIWALFQPSIERKKLESNQIKSNYFKKLTKELGFNLFEEAEEKGRFTWIKIKDGFLWFERPVKKRPPNIFVAKNKVNKMYQFANLKNNQIK